MKPLILFFLLACSAGAQEITRKAIIATVEHMGRLNAELQGKLDAEKSAHSEAQSSLEFFQNQVNTVTNQANEQAQRADKAENKLIAVNEKLAKETKHVSKLKQWIAGLAAAFGLVGLLLCGVPKMSFPYGAAACILIVAAIYFAVMRSI